MAGDELSVVDCNGDMIRSVIISVMGTVVMGL